MMIEPQVQKPSGWLLYSGLKAAISGEMYWRKPPRFWKSQDHAHVGDLDDVDQVGLGLALRQHLGVERAGLQADVAGLDLGEDLVEGGQQLDLALLGIGRIERERAFGLGLVDVGAGLEALHLAGVVAQLGLGLAPARQPDHQQCRTSGCNEPHWRPPHVSLCATVSRNLKGAQHFVAPETAAE